MIHYFTFGADGKRGYFLTDKEAELYNRFTRSFFDAQQAFLQEHGRRWHYTEPIRMPFGGEGQLRNDTELDAYNNVLVPKLNRQCSIRHRLHLSSEEKHMTDDFLVKKF